ncbi:hypothetical protein WME76_31635 [Sorangium sp. So ce119]|uniref:hypothetical protein n=1 Tax=Sorangium sp. So ce119 TaxID=3133279 RepID=UPI003F5FBF2E
MLGLVLALGVAACGGDDAAGDTGAGGEPSAGSGGGSTTGSGGASTSGSGAGSTSGAGAGSTSGAGAGATTGTGGDPDPDPANARTFDHRHAALEGIPASCLDALKSGDFIFHYTHRSHGSQIIVGAESIEANNPAYGFEAEYCDVPSETGVFPMWDGMLDSNLVKGDQYWGTEAGVNELRAILRDHPEIRYSMWAWSFEISEQTEESVQLYLDTLDALGQEFPEVTFIYMTGPGDAEYNRVNRAKRNQQIRDFCRDHGKILYDFEDLDVHWNGERHTAEVDGVEIPMQHPHYDVETSGNAEYEYTHTTQESCEVKARAFWRMMAELEGCSAQ